MYIFFFFYTADLIIHASVMLLLNPIRKEFSTAQARHVNPALCDNLSDKFHSTVVQLFTCLYASHTTVLASPSKRVAIIIFAELSCSDVR